MKLTLAIATLLSSADARREKRSIMHLVRNETNLSKEYDDLHRHPVVSTSNVCSKAVDRLKAGPANIPEVIHNKTVYTDTSFEGDEALFGGSSNTLFTSFENSVKSYMNSSNPWVWKKWP